MHESRQDMLDLTTRHWDLTYRTSVGGSDGKAVSILHDFYIPVLSCSKRYDRVAGYFRSSSLAAASQGFSAFARAGGVMRIVVGADLSKKDVQAILEGDAQRMAAKLNHELAFPETWPEDVTRGVELLAWMVAKGFLEVRVGFRVHGNTQAPLPFNAMDDGYVHEKWAVFEDGKQNRIYITGSLNESQTALTHNAENIDVHCDWWNETDKIRVQQAQDDFERLWHNQSPYLKVLSLPDAVHQRLLQIASNIQIPKEIDGTTEIKPKVIPPSAMERLQFALIKNGPKLPGGCYVGMETAPVTPWPHQEIVARRLIETWPYSYLMCDEVGLGKTIEAGLAIRSLVLSGMAKRVLIAAPASLTRQWQREMATKFFMNFGRAQTGPNDSHQYIFPHELDIPSSGLYGPNLAIVSTGLICRSERRKDLTSATDYDIVLLDEAHYARRKNTGNKDSRLVAPKYGNLYRLLRDHIRNKTKCLWLATATPMQLDWIEAFDLLQLINRSGAYQSDPSLTWTYYESLGELVKGQDIDPTKWELFRQTIKSLDFHDPFYRQYLNRSVIDAQMQTCARFWLDHGHIPMGIDQKYIRKLIFAASPLSRVMLRHNRPLLEIYRDKGQLGAGLAKREILASQDIRFTSLEKQVYDELEAYCNELKTQISQHVQSSAARTSLGFYLSFLRLRFASSLFAIKETIRRRRDRVIRTQNFQADQSEEHFNSDLEGLDIDDDQDDRFLKTLLKNRNDQDLEWEKHRLSNLLETLKDLTGTPSKMEVLLKILEQRRTPGGRIQQTVVFTRFYDTLTDIVERIRHVDSTILLGTYSGQGGQYVDPSTHKMKHVDREEIKHRFLREEIDLLVCTDAAAEGLNLQTANLLINFDLPWNPMKVEQRIGRIDRIGQKHETILVLNLCYVDSVEEIVYDRLLRRLAQAAGVVGTQQVSMLPVYEEDFRKLADGEITPETLERQARERIKRQKELTQSMEIPAKDLYEIYKNISKAYTQKSSPVGLKSFWEAISKSAYLKALGCSVPSDDLKQTICLSGIDNIPDGNMLTFDRTVYEEFFQDMDQKLSFGTYGDPVFDNLISIVNAYELPGCIKQMSACSDDGRYEIRAFAVACQGQSGETSLRLVKSWKDLNGLNICEDKTITDEELVPLQNRLEKIMQDQFAPSMAVGRLEQQNITAAKAQEILNLTCAHSLIKPIGTSEADNFFQTTADRYQVFEDLQQLNIPNLPTSVIRKIAQDLLFPIHIPQLGDTMNWTAPIFAASGALDAAMRAAESMRVRRSELTVGAVKGRIERDLKT